MASRTLVKLSCSGPPCSPPAYISAGCFNGASWASESSNNYSPGYLRGTRLSEISTPVDQARSPHVYCVCLVLSLVMRLKAYQTKVKLRRVNPRLSVGWSLLSVDGVVARESDFANRLPITDVLCLTPFSWTHRCVRRNTLVLAAQRFPSVSPLIYIRTMSQSSVSCGMPYI